MSMNAPIAWEWMGDVMRPLRRFEAQADRAATDGDRVTMNFVGKIDGEAFEGGTGEGVALVIGQGSFIPGFEDGLKGVKGTTNGP